MHLGQYQNGFRPITFENHAFPSCMQKQRGVHIIDFAQNASPITDPKPVSIDAHETYFWKREPTYDLARIHINANHSIIWWCRKIEFWSDNDGI
jgi:hypothetical protein